MIKTRLVGLLSHAKKYIVYTILWQWLALLSQVIAVFSIAELLEKVIYGSVTSESVKRTVLTLILVVVIRFFCERMGARSSYLACVDVKRILREKIYEKMLKLGASYREQVSSSEVVQVSTEGVEQLETYFGKYLPQLFYSLIAPVTLFVILCRVSLKASVVLLICVPLIPISIVVVQKIARKLLNKYWSIYTGLGDSFLENLQGLTTLKIYQADQQKADEMDAESQRFRQITMKVLTMQLNSTSVMDIVAYGGAAIGGIDLQVPAGSFVSLVGESGCGKSTIAGILSGKNREFSGDIRIGGVALGDVREDDLMEHVVLVRHNSYLFKGTVRENLQMAKTDATDQEMREVLKKVNLLGFLDTQNGLDTVLLEKAGNLSGGQCQRLVIARALLADAPVYIMDEATSNIDVESEELIMDVIHEMAKTRTVLLISHRLANVVQSDQIYFLKNGEIRECGKHEELMALGGDYCHLYESQSALENYGKEGNV